MSNRLRIFLAGATGAVGIVLSRLLSNKGYSVYGMTRKKEKAEILKSLNVEPIILNVYEKDKLHNFIIKIQPDIIIHQLTDLPFGLPEDKMEEGLIRNERIRDIGTRNLISAARKTTVKRFIAQSISFMYEDGEKPFLENHNLSSPILARFENLVLNQNFVGIVLRYGRFYGPNTGNMQSEGVCKVHVDAAAYAALLAIDNGSNGIYNIAENDGEVSINKAINVLKWDPLFRLSN